MNLGDPPDEEREMAVLGCEPRLDAGNVLREPDTMTVGDEPVLLTLEAERGHPDRLELEAPWPDEDDVVVEPAAVLGPDPDTGAVDDELRVGTGQNLEVGRPEQRAERSDDALLRE